MFLIYFKIIKDQHDGAKDYIWINSVDLKSKIDNEENILVQAWSKFK